MDDLYRILEIPPQSATPPKSRSKTFAVSAIVAPFAGMLAVLIYYFIVEDTASGYEVLGAFFIGILAVGSFFTIGLILGIIAFIRGEKPIVTAIGLGINLLPLLVFAYYLFELDIFS